MLPQENWKRVVGQRVLVREDTGMGKPIEVQVMEVTPSGNYVKLRHPSGYGSWNGAGCYVLIEALA
jgi:hypothetical protein